MSAAATVPQRRTAARPDRGWSWLHRLSMAVLAGGLAVVAVLSWAAYTANQRNEHRLLAFQTQEAGAVLGEAVSTIEVPLVSGAANAAATHGNAAEFERVEAPEVGTGRTFVSASLWRLGSGAAQLVANVGATPLIGEMPAPQAALFAQATSSGSLCVSPVLGGEHARLGYAVGTSSGGEKFVVYAESPLPAGRVAPTQPGSAFANLDYAIYLGATVEPSALVEANTPRLPLTGPTASASVPFGDSTLMFVAIATGELGGTLTDDLWWLIAVGGAAMVIGATLLTERLVRRRQYAEQVSAENERLYAEQRNVAGTLQRALLPEDFPQVPGIEIGVRYVAGGDGLEVGGDWYDVFDLGERRLLLTVGDVSGRGLRAATIMASIRYAIRAYALQGDSPTTIFAKLGEVVDIGKSNHFATALCAIVDTDAGALSFVNAGHPNPIVRDADGTAFVTTSVGPPLGVHANDAYVGTTLTVARGSTLLGFTDGLVERRGEDLETGLARLRDLVAETDAEISMDNLLDLIIETLAPGGPSDDIALLGVRWSR